MNDDGPLGATINHSSDRGGSGPYRHVAGSGGHGCCHPTGERLIEILEAAAGGAHLYYVVAMIQPGVTSDDSNQASAWVDSFTCD
jgi:hypothetical protein